MKSIIEIILTISGFAGFLLMGNDPVYESTAFPAVNICGLLILLVSVFILVGLSEIEE